MSYDAFLIYDDVHPIVKEQKEYEKITGKPFMAMVGDNPVQRIYEFPNGYGASCIKNLSPFEWERDLWEIAVLKNGRITYDTELTSDVIKQLSDIELEMILDRIFKL